MPLSDRDRVFCYSRARALLGLFVLLAAATARRLYGYDLAAAKDFVEELVAKQADKKSTV